MAKETENIQTADIESLKKKRKRLQGIIGIGLIAMVSLIAYYMFFDKEISLLVVAIAGGAVVASVERKARKIKEELKRREAS